MANKLYKIGRPMTMLRCLAKDEFDFVMLDMHEGAFNSHIRGLTLANKLL